MNERLTIQDLTDLLAAKHGMTKKDAEAFVKEFFLLIEQALENESIVKIKGLGTFKLIDVDSRESIKVNTGERFQIQEHTKVSFSPDTNLRDTINKPFAHFETVILNENTILEGTPVEEMEEDTAKQQLEEQLLLENSNEENIEKDKQKDIEEETPILYKEQPIEEEVSSITTKNAPEKEKSPVPYLIAVIVCVLLLCGGVVLYIYYPDLLSSLSEKNTLKMPPVTTQPIQPAMLLPDTIEQKDTITEVITTVRQQPSTASYSDSVLYKIVGTKTNYTIKEGETLTRVSLRFYGTKAMWPYIVKHNLNVIKNPDRIPYGTTIKIPELTKE